MATSFQKGAECPILKITARWSDITGKPSGVEEMCEKTSGMMDAASSVGRLGGSSKLRDVKNIVNSVVLDVLKETQAS